MASWKKLWEHANLMNAEWGLLFAKKERNYAALQDRLHEAEKARMRAEHELEILKLARPSDPPAIGPYIVGDFPPDPVDPSLFVTICSDNTGNATETPK